MLFGRRTRWARRCAWNLVFWTALLLVPVQTVDTLVVGTSEVNQTAVETNDAAHEVVAVGTVTFLILFQTLDLEVEGLLLGNLGGGQVEEFGRILLAFDLARWEVVSNRTIHSNSPLSNEYCTICCCWTCASLAVRVRTSRLQMV